MTKLIGLMFIFLSSVGIGVYSSYKTNVGLKQIREMINFMTYIKKQIEFFNAPVNCIYNSFDSSDEAFGVFVNDISSMSWTCALEKNRNLLYSEKIQVILRDFGANLGKSKKEDQMIHCEHYINILEREYEEIEKSAPEKKRTSVALGIYAGLMLVILFI